MMSLVHHQSSASQQADITLYQPEKFVKVSVTTVAYNYLSVTAQTKLSQSSLILLTRLTASLLLQEAGTMGESMEPEVASCSENGTRIAWKRSKVQVTTQGSGFKSKIFTITVGSEPSQQVFMAHQAYLSQSPVFERMCQAEFREGQSLQISLPDDNPQVIGAIIHYMYCGNIWALECEQKQGAGVHNDKDNEEIERSNGIHEEVDEDAALVAVLADLYVTSEKYRMSDLKFLIVEKLASVTNVHTHPITFLSTAQKIYGGIPDSNLFYRNFYRDETFQLLRHIKQKDMHQPLRDVFDEYISGGGILAGDTVAALTREFEFQLAVNELLARDQRLSKDKALQQQVEATEQQTRGRTAAEARAAISQADFDDLKVDHKKQHPSCRLCG
ncbi:MAG: hypothetical protein Q9174_005220 [Haloplaca sp. 1 TL-2023]